MDPFENPPLFSQKSNSQYSFDEFLPNSTEIEPHSFSRDQSSLSPSQKRHCFKPKTEILSAKLPFQREFSKEAILPILERIKTRETLLKNPFLNLKRFSTRTFIMNSSLKPQFPLKNSLKPEKFLKASLKSHFLFKEWDPFLLEKLVFELQCVNLAKSEVLIDKKTIIRSFYVITKGSILVSHKNMKEIRGIGELLCVSAIFETMEPGIEISSIEDDTVLWGVEFVKFQEILKNNAYSALQENRKLLEEIEYFAGLSQENRVEIAFYLKTLKFQQGEIVEKSEENLYIVKSGIVKLYEKNESLEEKNEISIRSIGEKQVFCEEKIEENYDAAGLKTLKTFKVECEEAVLLKINKKTLHLILGSQYSRMVYVSELRFLFNFSEILMNLDPVSKERIIRKLKVAELKKGEEISKTPINSLIFLLRGEIESNFGVSLMKNKGIFDEESLIKPVNYSFSSIKMASDGLIAEIPFAKLSTILKITSPGAFYSFFSVLKESYLINSDELESPVSPFTHMKSMSSSLKTAINEIRSFQRYELISILKEIGDGQFGLVLLAKIESRYFALKVISRFWVVENSIEEYLVSEKKICRMIESPFIIHLEFTFRDQFNIYFLFEYIEGLDLFKFMNIAGIIPTELAKFFTANLILAIEYLHHKNIIHRDLKPENIMIAKNGYLKVIDLGAAKLFGFDSLSWQNPPEFSFCSHRNSEEENEEFPLKRTYTLIGTHDFCFF